VLPGRLALVATNALTDNPHNCKTALHSYKGTWLEYPHQGTQPHCLPGGRNTYGMKEWGFRRILTIETARLSSLEME
jgi:hypothetical protein